MKSITIQLANRTYKVESLKFKAEREWRKKYDKPIEDLLGAISNVQAISGREYEKTGDLLRDVGGVLLSRAGDLVNALLNSPDTLFEAICDYSPALRADREYIEENAYQDEIAKAFLEVLQIAYPFGFLLGMMKSLGSLESQTMQNSPSPNGDSSTTNSTT